MPRRPTLGTVIVSLVLQLTFVPAAYAQEAAPGWNQFRGPNATGIATVTKAPPVDFGPGKNVLWKTAVPVGHSSPVIWGDRLFLTAFDAQAERLLLLAIDRNTGKELWRRDIAYEKLGNVHAVSTPATATPVVDGERVYVYFAPTGLSAYDLDGAPVWTLPIPFQQVNYGDGTSPVIAGNRLLLNRESRVDPFTMAVDRRSGKELWRVAHDGPKGPGPYYGHSTPVVVNDQVIVYGFGRITSYDLATGDRRWWVNAVGSGTSTPAVVGNMLYVGTWTAFGETDQVRPLPDFATALRERDTDTSGTLSQAELKQANIILASRPDMPDVPGASFGVAGVFGAFDQDKSGDLTAAEWAVLEETVKAFSVDHGLLAIRTDGRGDVTRTHVVWRENKALPEVPSPLVFDNHVYYVRNGGILTCLDAGSGRVLYRQRLDAPGPYFSSPIEAGNHIYVGSGEGLMVVLAPGDEMQVLARNDMGEPIYATPAVSPDGVLYVRTPSALYAFAEQAASAGWNQFRGPNATGIAAVTKAPPIDFGPDRNVLWKAAVPIGHSSPVIWGDRLFLTAFDAGKERLLVLGLDRTTGKEVWRQEIAYEKLGNIHAVSTPATATPVVDGARVYAYFAAAGLFAYDLDGTPAWNLPIPFEQTQFGSGTSPVLAGDRLILHRAANADGFIMAVDRRSGAVLWKQARVPPGAPGHSTPVILGDQIVVHGPGRVESYDLATGARRWWVQTPTSGSSTPAVDGTMVYVATWSPFGEADQRGPAPPDFETLLRQHDTDKSGTISRPEMVEANLVAASRPDVPDVPGATFTVASVFGQVDRDKDGEVTAVEWAAILEAVKRMANVEHGVLAIRTDGQGDVTATNVVWRESKSIPEIPSPLAFDHRLYYVRNGGILTCLDTASGTVVYRARLGAPGPFYSSPVEAGGRLYVGSGEGLMVVFAPGDDMQVLARNDLGDPIFATPAISPEGVIYVRTTTTLYAFAEQ